MLHLPLIKHTYSLTCSFFNLGVYYLVKIFKNLSRIFLKPFIKDLKLKIWRSRNLINKKIMMKMTRSPLVIIINLFAELGLINILRHLIWKKTCVEFFEVRPPTNKSLDGSFQDSPSPSHLLSLAASNVSYIYRDVWLNDGLRPPLITQI